MEFVRDQSIQSRHQSVATGTHNVRGRFDALHGPNGVCKSWVARSVSHSVSWNGIGDYGEGRKPLVLTALFECYACFRKLDKDDVAEALLSIVCDGHRSDTGLVIILDHLVIFRVSFRWNRGVKPTSVTHARQHSLTMVRLRVSKAEGNAR